MAVSLTRPRQHPHGLPRAAQLGPVAGIPPVDAGAESDRDMTEPVAVSLAPTSPLATADTDAGMRKTTTLPFHLAPPLAADRLAPLRPPRPRNSRVRGALYILIAGLVAGSIAYQITGGGAFTATDAAQAALSAAGVGR